MKIRDVSLTVFERPEGCLGQLPKIKGQSVSRLLSECVAVRIETEDGLTGETLSMGGGLGLARYIATSIKPFLVGQNASQRERLWQELWERERLWLNPLFALGTIDVALWDLYGKSVNTPIHELLGSYRSSIPVYASSMTLPSVEAFAEEAVEYKERGLQGYKIHPWGDPKRDVAACRAVREAVGDDYPLMVDVVSAYNQVDALKVGRELDELNFHWYEQPLPEYDLYGYKALADALDTPIAALEMNEGSLYAVAPYLRERAVDIVRADPSFKCGIGPSKKIASMAEGFGLNVEIHTNPNPVLNAAALHVALSVRNTEFFEQLVPEPLFDFASDTTVQIDSAGYAHAPEGPGIGITIDWEFVERYKTAEL